MPGHHLANPVAERPDDSLAPDALLRLGRAYQTAGMFDRAIAAYQRNQVRYPQSLAAAKSAVPLAQAYVKNIFSKLPAPNNGNNLLAPLRGVFNSRQEIIRIDHTFSPQLSLSGRFLHDSIPTIEPGGLFTNNFSPGVATTETDSPGRSDALGPNS